MDNDETSSIASTGVERGDVASVLRLGAAVSVVQSALFVVIGAAAVILGVDRLVADGFAALPATDLAAFRTLCVGFIAIAVLGLAITPAERIAVASAHPGWAAFGANLALLGHTGTIAYFSWWLLITRTTTRPATGAGSLAPLAWGSMFELAFVGAWVWIIAGLIWHDQRWPRGFVVLSLVKGTCFWFAFAAVLANRAWMIRLGVGAVTFGAGPAWHLWIARLFSRTTTRPS